ncbi:MAG: hypothetical protein ABSG85_08545 [Spirochaetia bacterium]|jgi:hypothetical protein
MKNPDDIYRRLQRHLDRMSIAFPATRTGVELRLLKHLFSPVEAKIALAMSSRPEPVEKIRRRLKGIPITPEALRAALDTMARKGAIVGGRGTRGGKPVPAFGMTPLVVGMFELQVDRLTKEFVEDIHAYQDEAFSNPILTRKTSQMRTVPINARVGEPGAVGRYDDIRGHIRETNGPFGVMNCICRQAQNLLGHTCTSSETNETCLSIGRSAVYLQRLGRGSEMPRAPSRSRSRLLQRSSLAHAVEVALDPFLLEVVELADEARRLSPIHDT